MKEERIKENGEVFDFEISPGDMAVMVSHGVVDQCCKHLCGILFPPSEYLERRFAYGLGCGQHRMDTMNCFPY